MAQLLDKIRRAVETSGKTRYRIAKESGISAAQLSRLVNGQSGMTVETIERLADYLGFRIVIEPKGKANKGR
ncbi:MAG: helix-turn-helix domain-containing protein [Phycisphaerae bacterium]|nr:helix-turn-helix domain-containing protein [Phycisphaerae bacterium]